MTPTQELIEEARVAAAGSPYVVHERPYGFDLAVDVADARWWTLLRRNALERVFTHEVHLDEADRTLSVTDVSQRLEWDGPEVDGPPGLHVEHRTPGRSHGLSLDNELGVDDGGRVGAVVDHVVDHAVDHAVDHVVDHAVDDTVDHTFEVTEGRELIRAAADAAGWAEKRGRDQSIGLAVAGIAAAAVLVGALVALVISFSG
jgi:hypothetical protein